MLHGVPPRGWATSTASSVSLLPWPLPRRNVLDIVPGIHRAAAEVTIAETGGGAAKAGGMPPGRGATRSNLRQGEAGPIRSSPRGRGSRGVRQGEADGFEGPRAAPHLDVGDGRGFRRIVRGDPGQAVRAQSFPVGAAAVASIPVRKFRRLLTCLRCVPSSSRSIPRSGSREGWPEQRSHTRQDLFWLKKCFRKTVESIDRVMVVYENCGHRTTGGRRSPRVM